MGNNLIRIALVTGGASGIGKEIVRELLSEGFIVAAFDLNKEALTQTVTEFESIGEVLPLIGDAGSEEDVNFAVSSTIEKYGRIDVLVNNAGGSFRINGSIETICPDDWDKVIRLNLKNQYLFTHAVIPIMKQNGYGRIVCMSSKAGRSRGSGNSGAPYAAAKAGIIGMVRQTSASIGVYGITINAIAPGTIISGERIRSYWEQRSEEEIENHLTGIPVHRFGNASDVSYAVKFLCDERASFITGAVIDVNGGAWVG